MSRKDFELIAYVLRRYGEDREALPLGLIESFADALAGTNPRFQRQRFLDAARTTQCACGHASSTHRQVRRQSRRPDSTPCDACDCLNYAVAS